MRPRSRRSSYRSRERERIDVPARLAARAPPSRRCRSCRGRHADVALRLPRPMCSRPEERIENARIVAKRVNAAAPSPAGVRRSIARLPASTVTSTAHQRRPDRRERRTTHSVSASATPTPRVFGCTLRSPAYSVSRDDRVRTSSARRPSHIPRCRHRNGIPIRRRRPATDLPRAC